MSKGNKELTINLGFIFIAVLLTYKLPHDSYSIIQYVIMPIRFENSVLYLSGIIPLVMFIIGLRGLFRLERFANKNKLLIFIIVVILVVPIMRSIVDIVKVGYYWTINDGIRSIDLTKTDIKVLEITDNEAKINIHLWLIDYGRDKSDFKVRMYLPDSLKTCFNTEFVEFGGLYQTFGYSTTFEINKNITVHLSEGCTEDKVLDSKWYWETYKFEFYYEKESVKVMYHDI